MKNILVCHRPGGAFGYISDGWVNCLRDKGFNVQRWNSNLSSWREFKPDLYIGCSAHRQPIPRDDNCIYAMHVNPYGPIDCKDINEPQSSIQYISELRPQVVFGYGFDDDRVYWDYWTRKLSIKWVPMPTAVDRSVFFQTDDIENRNIDISYVGGKWPYKGVNIDSYLMPVVNKAKKLNVKFQIFGWGDWPSDICDGVISDSEINKLFNSSKLGPCISEPHTYKWGFDLPERVWKVSACGMLPIHDPVPTLRYILPDLPMAKCANSYLDLVTHFLNNDVDRINLAKKLQQEVLNNHSYHNRISRLFSDIGWKEESEKMLVW